MDAHAPPSPYIGYEPVSGSGSRPSLGFHLGIALLMATIFTLAALFSCCYHWDRIRRSLLGTVTDADLENSKLEEGKKEESLPVIMPGDDVPRFIALTCPLEPPRLHGNFVAEVKSKRVEPPPKPAALDGAFYTFVGPY